MIFFMNRGSISEKHCYASMHSIIFAMLRRVSNVQNIALVNTKLYLPDQMYGLPAV